MTLKLKTGNKASSNNKGFHDTEPPLRLITHCRACKKTDFEPVITLGPMPLANSLIPPERLQEGELFFPLSVARCSNCSLVQLREIIRSDILFGHYLYSTGTSHTMRTHFSELAQNAARRLKINKNHLVVDIGSNDGTLLKGFERYTSNILGVEPAKNIAQIANEHGVETWNQYWNPALAQRIKDKKKRAIAIAATNVFAHVNDLDSFLEAAKILLDPQGALIIEVPYLLPMLQNTEFDTIYHEHLSVFSARALTVLFRRKGFRIMDIETLGVHGGSLRIWARARLDPKERVADSVASLLAQEKTLGLDTTRPYEKFRINTQKIGCALRALLTQLKSRGKSIAAYGAAAKGTTLLNYCRVGCDLIDFVVDQNPLKQGLLTPGTHIPIWAPEKINKERPDFVLIIPWNLEQEIRKANAPIKTWGGKFIVPIPKPKIL